MKSNAFQKWRESKSLTILVVAVALCLDNMILTVVVSILPAYLYETQYSNKSTVNVTLSSNSTSGNASSILSQTKHENLMGETSQLGFMLASKSIVQLLFNPVVGPLTQRIGYINSMFIGFVVMFMSTLLFAFGQTYPVLFTARAVQGIGSSCSTVAGMAMLADRFTQEDERSKAMAFAITGLSLGVVIGPPFGGFMYEFFDKTSPFLVICFLTLLDGCLLLLTVQPKFSAHEKAESTSIGVLIRDPYILLTTGGLLVINIGLAFIETGLPIWMLDVMNASRWQLGAAILPSTISYLLGINIFRPILNRIGRWCGATIGMFLLGLSMLILSFCRTLTSLIFPLTLLGACCGLVEIALLPELGHLVDIRHSASYANVYAIGDLALCLGFGIGPIMCALITNAGLTFDEMIVGSGLIIIFFSPSMICLRNPEKKEEETPLLPKNKRPSEILHQNDLKILSELEPVLAKYYEGGEPT